jgi:hypothetical protein
LFIIT